MLPIALVLGLIWGIVWARVLQRTRMGRFLADKRTWLTVVIGVGGDLLIALLIVPFAWWWRVFAVIALSSLGIIYRSLSLELHEKQEEIDAIADQDRQ